MSDQQHEDGDDEISDRETQAALRRGTRDGSPELPLSFFQQLPKTDLHVHLDGSLRLETILDLAEKGGIELPSTDPDELRRFMNLGANCGSLVEYLKAFDVTLARAAGRGALRRTAYELAEDAALENVRYMEVRYAPMLHTRKGLADRIVESVLAGLRAAHAKYGIESNIIICGIRNISTPSLEMAELCVAYKNRGVVAFDLAGAEYDHPAKHHRRLPARPRQQHQRHHPRRRGLRPRVHPPGHPRLRRPPHRPRLPPARERRPAPLRQRPPPPRSSAALSSNVQTGAVRDLASHPLKLYFDLGLRVTINTDNRLVTDTTCPRSYGTATPPWTSTSAISSR
jgi:adenosine deaminase